MSENISIILSPTVSLELIFVQGTGKSTFTMGGTDSNNKPCEVAVGDFWLAKYPVTQAQWDAVMRDIKPNPSFFKGKNRPVENISWYDAMAFIKALNALPDVVAQLAGKKFALPTEAQWEYAARGGVHSSPFGGGKGEVYEYAGSNSLDEVGWYRENSHNETKPVGLKLPNQLGIYDMSGNVWEWCLSKYTPYPYREDAERNAIDDSGDSRVLRGGSWDFGSYYCTTAGRDDNHPAGGSGNGGCRPCLFQ